MPEIAWELEHSVEAEVPQSAAWEFWSNIQNWDDPPARFELEEPFRTGSQGKTHIPGQEPVRWIIRDVKAPEAGTIEIQLNGAQLRCEWRFQRVTATRTRVSQHLLLTGDKAREFAPEAKSVFSANLEPGMNRIARAMEAHWAR